MKSLLAILAAGSLTACSSVTKFTDVTDLVDYSDHKSIKVLAIPPDLDAPSFNKTYVTSISDAMDASKSIGLDSVPLIDKTMGPPPKSSVKIVQQGGQLVMRVEDDSASVWKRFDDTLKGMGMTISKTDQASGLVAARDRSLVSDPGSPIGRLLNEALGKVNEGEEYQFRVRGSGKVTVIEVADKQGKSLSAADARLILSRLRKEYTS